MISIASRQEIWFRYPEGLAAASLLHGFHALRYPWMHTETIFFDEVAAQAAQLSGPGEQPTWERHFIRTEVSSEYISRLVLPLYRKVGAFVMAKQDHVNSTQVREFLHQVAEESSMEETHPLPEGHLLDGILPSDEVFERMHFNGLRKICRPLVTFIDEQRTLATQDQTQSDQAVA